MKTATTGMTNYLPMLLAVMALAALLQVSSAVAQQQANPFTHFDKHTVVHTVFTTSFLQPEIANTYGFSRGRDQALVNISVVKNPSNGSNLGLPAKLTGTATNLMQQKTSLEFIEIKEGAAVYYLAPFRFINEEISHFDIQIQVDGQSYDLNFTKKLYAD